MHLPVDPRTLPDFGASSSAFQHQHGYLDQQVGGYGSTYNDVSFAMAANPSVYAAMNHYGYYPPAYHHTNDAAHAINSGSGHVGPGAPDPNASLTAAAPTNNHFGPDWFAPAQKQLHNFTPQSMPSVSSTAIVYPPGANPYTQYMSNYYPYASHQSVYNPYAMQQTSAGADASAYGPAPTIKAADPVVESH